MASRKTATASRSPRSADDGRTRMMRAVRAACKSRMIDDESRKAIQLREIGKASMSDMTAQELARLLDHLNKGRRAPMGHRSHVGKIKALWWTLYWLAEIDDPGDGAINAFVERQTGTSALRFLDHRKAASVIEALKGWAGRAGVNWPGADSTEAIALISPGFTDQLHDRHAVLSAIGGKLQHAGALGDYFEYVRAALHLPLHQWNWSARELDTAIRMLGKKLRQVKGKR